MYSAAPIREKVWSLDRFELSGLILNLGRPGDTGAQTYLLILFSLSVQQLVSSSSSALKIISVTCEESTHNSSEQQGLSCERVYISPCVSVCVCVCACVCVCVCTTLFLRDYFAPFSMQGAPGA